MLPGIGRQHAPARRALDEALLDEIGLDNVLDRIARLGKTRRDRLDANGPAAEVDRDHVEIAPVELVEAETVHMQPRQRLVGDLLRHGFGPRHFRKVSHAPQQAAGDARCAARTPRDLARAGIGHTEPHQPRPAPDDQFQFLDRVEIQPHRNAEAVSQRRGQEPEARGGGNEGEFRQIDLHRARRRPLADDEVELEILHCRIKDFLHRRIEPVDFVDEEHIALLEIGEKRRKVAGFRDDRTGGGAEIDAEFLRHDLRQRGLAEARRPDEEHMVQRLTAILRRLDKDLQIGARLRLPGELVERLRPQSRIHILAAFVGRHQPGSFTHANRSSPLRARVPRQTRRFQPLVADGAENKAPALRTIDRPLMRDGSRFGNHPPAFPSKHLTCQFLEAEADQLGAVGALPAILERRRHRIGSLVARIAEIGER